MHTKIPRCYFTHIRMTPKNAFTKMYLVVARIQTDGIFTHYLSERTLT